MDLVWQNFEDKLYVDYNKIYIFDLKTGEKIKHFYNMLFDYLPADEASTYGRESKYGYNGVSKEFILYAIQSDKEGNIYLSYVDYLPIITEGINVTNVRNVTLGAVAYLKLDENYENMWAHLFYFTDWSANKLIFENGNIHAFGNSYEKISAAEGSDLKAIYKSQIDAANMGEVYRYDIALTKNGTFEIKELIGNCKISFKEYDWMEGDYFPELNSFIYCGGPEGKNQPSCIFIFGF